MIIIPCINRKVIDMSIAKQQPLIEKIYEEILTIKEEIRELKSVLISEVEPEEDEREVLRVMEHEAAEGKYRPWDEVKKDLESE